MAGLPWHTDVLMNSGQVAALLIRLFIALALIRGCIATFRYARLVRTEEGT